MLQENFKTVAPKTEKERKSVEYLSYLGKMFKDREQHEGELFYNSEDVFASLLMAALLKNTNHSLKMYCTGLRPGILCGRREGDGLGYEGAYWEAFKDFFSEKNIRKFSPGSIKILIQTDRYKSYLPFRKVFKCMENCPGIIEVKLIRKNGIRDLFRFLNTGGLGKNNFAIFDDKAYRIEYDMDKYLSSGSFYDPEKCKILREMFDKEFKDQRAIPIHM